MERPRKFSPLFPFTWKALVTFSGTVNIDPPPVVSAPPKKVRPVDPVVLPIAIFFDDDE